MVKRRLLVEGWRFLPHSYAIVNRAHLLAFARRTGLELRVRDLALPFDSWGRPSIALDRPDREAVLRALPEPEPGFVPEATLRFAHPFDLSPPTAGRLAVICTSEYQVFETASWRSPIDGAALAARSDLTVVTPSHWSAEGLRRIGIPQAKIAVVPHGVDTDLFAPDAESGAAMRQQLGIGAGVVFMSAGAMTGNKGADLLMRAFAELRRRRNDVFLLLKGTDQLYRSNARLGAIMHGLSAEQRSLIQPGLIYGGTTLDATQMAALYRAADVYVSPYRAEGFNLPVLEAMASGLPVICTRGGPTDDFVGDDCGAKIDSRRQEVATGGGAAGLQLEPDLAHLSALMVRAAGDASWRRERGAAARRRAADFTWDAAVDRLLRLLF